MYTDEVNQVDFKKSARGLFIGILVASVLAGFNISFTSGKSYGDNWKFALTHPTILLHIVVATIILVGSAVLLVRSILSKKTSWIVWSLLGLVLLILAYIYGEIYVKTLSKSAIDAMGNAGAGALMIYGLMWFLNRSKKNKTENKEHTSDLETGNK
jgi:nucleoside recognition membrane protein YjiH